MLRSSSSLRIYFAGNGPTFIKKRVRAQFYSGQNHQWRHRASQLFQPLHVTPFGEGAPAASKKEDAYLSKSTRLLLDRGLVRSIGKSGNLTLLPLAMRSIEKINKMLDEHMRQVGGQKILMPTLVDASLWKRTGRYESMKGELFKCNDRHDSLMILGPTHEESITKLLADIGPNGISHKSLPLRVYQISSKFRDEMRPRYGVIRSREFLMLDMYTFDTDITAAMETYEAVNNMYKEFFRKLLGDHNDLILKRVVGDTGDIGGQRSHEYHVITDIGQDDLLVCNNCDRGNNVTVDPRESLEECRDCEGTRKLDKVKGIEVGHTFLLADHYSEKLGAKYAGLDSGNHAIHMGCYGIGVTRLMAACVEALSTDKELRWPRTIAPFTVCVIVPKPGSREAVVMTEAYKLYDSLNETSVFSNDVILDERDKMTVGKKLREAYKNGYLYIVLFGKDCVGPENPQVELHCLGTAEPQVNKIPLQEVQNVLLYLHRTSA